MLLTTTSLRLILLRVSFLVNAGALRFLPVSNPSSGLRRMLKSRVDDTWNELNMRPHKLGHTPTLPNKTVKFISGVSSYGCGTDTTGF